MRGIVWVAVGIGAPIHYISTTVTGQTGGPGVVLGSGALLAAAAAALALIAPMGAGIIAGWASLGALVAAACSLVVPDLSDRLPLAGALLVNAALWYAVLTWSVAIRERRGEPLPPRSPGAVRDGSAPDPHVAGRLGEMAKGTFLPLMSSMGPAKVGTLRWALGHDIMYLWWGQPMRVDSFHLNLWTSWRVVEGEERARLVDAGSPEPVICLNGQIGDLCLQPVLEPERWMEALERCGVSRVERDSSGPASDA